MVRLQSVSKLYKLYGRPSDRLLEVVPFIRRRVPTQFWALRNISLEVERGEILGVVGPNGSGKSTLLQIVSGIVQPTSGRVSTEGRIAALLELGAGFNPEFTGRENVYLSSEIVGLSRKQVDARFSSIEQFAEIGEFIDRPVKEYSSGMYIRLAFATSIHVEPEILVVDEALAVGDAIFANRCLRKLEELKDQRTTILFVSHDLGIVKRLCSRAVLLIKGEIAAHGKPSEVVNRYVGFVHDHQALENRTSPVSGNYRHGDSASSIERVRLLDSSGRHCTLASTGDRVILEIDGVANSDLDEVVVGMLIRSRLGLEVFGTNTRIEGVRIGPVYAQTKFVVRFEFLCLLNRGDYTVTVATQHPSGASQDWLDDALQITISSHEDVAGVARLDTSVSWDVTTPAR